MDLLKSNHTVPLDKADKAPLKQVTNQTPQYATDGDPAQAIPATIFPAYHYNSVIAEIVNAIKAGGKTPSNDDWGQLASIITDFIRQIGELNGHFNNVKEVGKDAQGVYVIYEDNGKDQKTYILSPSDLDDIKKRLSAAEGTIVNHTNRLDNYGASINRIVNDELPAKADLNGSGNQDFNAKDLKSGSVNAGGLFLGGANNVSTSKALWTFSPQLLDIDNNPYYKGLLNLIYAGINSSDDQPGTARQILQIIVDRSQYTTGIITDKTNQKVVNSRAFQIFSSVNVYGKSVFHDGTSGANGDLAENYKADRQDYFPGQVMMYSVDGNSEVSLCSNPQQVFGVISTNPAHLINSQDKKILDFDFYIPIALTGRVPVLIDGEIKKGQRIMPTVYGTAVAWDGSATPILGRSLENKIGTGIKLVECFVQAVV